MGKRSQRSIINEESCIKEKKTKIKNYVTVESNSNDVEEPAPATEKKVKNKNKLEVNSNKVTNLKKSKIIKFMVESTSDDAKEPVKTKKVKHTEVLNKSTASDIEKVVKEKRSKKKKYNTVDLNHDSEPTKEGERKKSEAANKSAIIDSEKANKIKLVIGEEPQQTPALTGTPNKKFLNEDEAEVKDEDIDKFCDEVDEEDNAQFEDWVKLIEAKLHSNKKKPV